MSVTNSGRGLESFGHHEQHRILLKLAKQTIGRADECEIIIPNSTVSRRHAAIVVTHKAITLVDLRSRNGTFLNDAKVDQAILRTNDRVRFGTVEFVVSEVPPTLVPIMEDESSTSPINSIDRNGRSPTISLSPARQRVLKFLLAGLTEKQIAKKLGVSIHTVHNQVRDIYLQFEVNSRAELLASFIQRKDIS
jgi:pSer/pThr/pTyr-binding forkhead associated (FHA) protein